LFDDQYGAEGFSHYLIGDLGYPLLPWLMILHRSNVHLLVAEALFNKKLQRGCSVVENAFGILKQTFKELLTKSNLDVVFLPDVIVCCAILHNMLLGQSHEDIENLFKILQTKGLRAEGLDDVTWGHDIANIILETAATVIGADKRRALRVHLTVVRQQYL